MDRDVDHLDCTMNDLELIAAFVNSASVAELRAALQLPGNLGKFDPDFVRTAGAVFARIGRAGFAPSAENFAMTWAERFDQDLRDCRRVLDAALAV